MSFSVIFMTQYHLKNWITFPSTNVIIFFMDMFFLHASTPKKYHQNLLNFELSKIEMPFYLIFTVQYHLRNWVTFQVQMKKK